jgi:RNA polymerase sigma-32 factor
VRHAPFRCAARPLLTAGAGTAQGGHVKRPQTTSDPLDRYLADISRVSLLTVEEERRLAREFREQGDTRAAHRLVEANLRFVVKVAYEYRSYGLKMSDLIQEGNIGLMKAVQKFDPGKEIRLISYAVWWIRAYIQNYILRSWSLVKIGTTQAQRKLFFSLARTKHELEKLSGHSSDPSVDVDKIAKRLRVRASDVEEMQQRMEGRDLSLDAPMSDDGMSSHVDFVASDGTPADDDLGRAQEDRIVTNRVREALERLDPRERHIVKRRLMDEDPDTLKELGEQFGFSRERARQIEIRAREKLRRELGPLALELEWGDEGSNPLDG